ncbi:MAG: prolyl oligopeptidase family serine peptidase [Planctomycetota bacterium]
MKNAGAGAPANMPSGFLFQDQNGIACTVYVPRDVEPIGTLVFLHGSGECGSNGTLQLTVGLPRWLMLQPQRWPFAVVIPQKPEQDRPWLDYHDAVLGHLDRSVEAFGLDARRVALTGLSQGGNGAFQIGARAASRFRAVVPVCGFAEFNFRNPSDRAGHVERIADALGATPMRIYHGEADTVVPAQESVDIHAALQARGSNALLELYPGVGHNAWDLAYGDSDMAEWLAELLAS